MACVSMSIADLASHIIVAMETPYTLGAVMPKRAIPSIVALSAALIQPIARVRYLRLHFGG